MDSNTAHILAGQRTALLRMVSELDRVIEEGSAWRALSVFESVAIAAGGVETEAWKARHEELRTALAESPSFKLRLRLVAAIEALPSDDQDFLDAVNHRPQWAQPAGRESIAQRIATLEPSATSAESKTASGPSATGSSTQSGAPHPSQSVAPPVAAAAAPTVQRAPRANDYANDPVASAVRSIMDSLRVSLAVATQAEAAQAVLPVVASKTHSGQSAPTAPASRPDLSGVVSATSQTATKPAAQSAALETTARDAAVTPDIADTDLNFDEADIDEADVVVVQKRPLSTVSLEQRLERMDRDAAGLLRANSAAKPGAPKPDNEDADGFESLEAKVEIVKRPTTTPLVGNGAGHGARAAVVADARPGARPGTRELQNTDESQSRPRPARIDYPPQPAAAFIAETVEASVEIVRPATATPSSSWRQNLNRDLEPVPVDRLLKTLDGNLNGR